MQTSGADGIPGRVKSMHKGPGQNGAQHVCTIEGPMCEKYFGNYDAARKGGFSILALCCRRKISPGHMNYLTKKFCGQKNEVALD